MCKHLDFLSLCQIKTIEKTKIINNGRVERILPE